MRKRLIIAIALVAALAACVSVFMLADTQTRFRYEKRQNAEGPFYVEIYEEREQDLDSTANPKPFYTTKHFETKFFDKTLKVSQLNAERVALQAQGAELQQRINAINALP